MHFISMNELQRVETLENSSGGSGRIKCKPEPKLKALKSQSEDPSCAPARKTELQRLSAYLRNALLRAEADFNTTFGETP